MAEGKVKKVSGGGGRGILRGCGTGQRGVNGRARMPKARTKGTKERREGSEYREGERRRKRDRDTHGWEQMTNRPG